MCARNETVPGHNPVGIVAPAAAFAIDLSRPIGGTGWYPAEQSGDAYFRWTGPQPRFDLEVLLPQHHSYRCDVR